MEKLYEEIGTKRGQKVAFQGKTTKWYWYQKEWYQYHLTEPIWYRYHGTKTSGTNTNIQNVFGTGTKHSGTGTTVSKSPDLFL